MKGAIKVKVKKEKVPVILFAFAFLAIMCTLFFHSISLYKNISTIDMKIKVGNYIGFNLDNTYLEFGTAMPGGSSERNIEIDNIYEESLFVEIDIEKKWDVYHALEESREIKKEWVILSDNNFVIGANEKKSVKFTIVVPEGTEYGNYTAQAVIKFSYIEV
jgi:hypothetical protein